MQNHSMTIGVDGDGGVTFADGRYLIRKVAPPLPGFDAEGLALPSGDGLEVYEFDRNGRHLRTRDGLTGAVTKTFEYDAAKRLIGVVDAYGNRTQDRARRRRHGDRDRRPRRAAHDAELNGDGFLETVTNPAGAGSTASPTTTPAACSRASRSPSGAHDPLRLRRRRAGWTRHRGADGEERTLTRTEGEFGPTVTIKTAGGKDDQVLDGGARQRRSPPHRAGAQRRQDRLGRRAPTASPS